MSRHHPKSRNIEPPSLFEEIVRLLTRPAIISKLEVLTDNFRLITLEGDNLKGVSWIPGQKIEVFLDSRNPTTYTPISWDSLNGVTRIVVYGRGATSPGTKWVNTARPGEMRRIWGPRQSLDLRELKRPAVFFGDETSIGLAHALGATRDGLREVAFLFEAWSSMETKIVLRNLGISDAVVLERTENMVAIEAAMHRLIDNLAPNQFVLTGEASSIRHVTKLLRHRCISASKLKIMEHWSNAKSRFD
jgi:NADPH-dependent ferric siderophore reductase